MASEKSLLRAFLGTASLQLIGRGLAVITGVIFARVLGPEEFGRYSFVISIIALLVLPAIAGIPQLIVRETSRYRVDQEYHLLLGMWKWATRYSLIICMGSMFVALALIWLDYWPESISHLMLIGIVLIPFKGILSRLGASINGLQRPELAQLPMVILAPLIVLVAIAISYVNNVQITPSLLLKLQILTHVVAVVLSIFLLNWLVNQLNIKGKPSYAKREWQSSLLPFTILTVVGTMNNELATVFLGFLGSEEAIGYFKVAMQGITLLALGLQAVNTVSGPRIAGMYKQGKVDQTQVLLKQSVKLSVLSSVPFAIVLIFFGELLIKFLFGEAYLPAAELLTILCIGQIINVCMGSVGLVLNMTGNEKRTLRAQFITLILTVILLGALIPMFQAVGAAIAVSLGLVCWNVIMAFDVYRLTGLKTWIH
ncbi:Polysacc_synt_C domain-containing protein [Vibrio chagasii]|nr:Polysacc_synt_C domain-containing protein [Vibrio chagasii]CAH7166759.1 Polysacc_synt_C domain-containing protein [Vibrio chagasii]CAH7357932.1 Polysacc_synt_C domain-containing protein [Vibrio chagasii]